MNECTLKEEEFPPVSLEAMLWAREKRVWRQQRLNQQFHQPLIAFTMNIPGEYKAGLEINRGFDLGLDALIKALDGEKFPRLHQEIFYLITGPEAYLVTVGDSRRIKMATVALEEGHPLGRLFDMDVITPNRQKVGREELGLGPRKCLLCDEDARVCARSHRHRLVELQKKMIVMLTELSVYPGIWSG